MEAKIEVNIFFVIFVIRACKISFSFSFPSFHLVLLSYQVASGYIALHLNTPVRVR